MRLAEMQRATDIAFAYGNRLDERSNNLRRDGLQRLVAGYPAHGFVIDRKEAATIFVNVSKPDGVLLGLSEAVYGITRPFVNADSPKVLLANDVSPTGNNHEDIPDATTGQTGSSEGEPAGGQRANENEPEPIANED